jgi:hypothetical protein
MSMGLEYKKADAAGHPKASKAIQNLRIEQDTTRAEKWTITSVFNSVGTCSGSYYLSLQSPMETTLWKSAAIKCNEPSNTFGGIIAAFFQGSTRLGGDTQTDLLMYDAAGIKTSTASLAKKYVYTMTTKKRSAASTFSSY